MKYRISYLSALEETTTYSLPFDSERGAVIDAVNKGLLSVEESNRLLVSAYIIQYSATDSLLIRLETTE